MFYPTTYGQPMPMDKTLDNKLLAAQIECETYACKLRIKADAEIQTAEQKQWLKAMEAEQKRSQYHDIAIDSNGTVVEISNSSNPSDTQHLICNARYLTPILLLRASNTDDQILVVQGLINENSFSVFLNPTQIGACSYVYRKLLSAGVKFYADSVSLQKALARNLIVTLLSNCNQTEYIYDTPGWHLSPDKTFIFIDQEDLSWTKITKNIH